MTEVKLSLGGVEASGTEDHRLSVLIWGPAGIGKTTLAFTAPGRKALINFDPDGPASIPTSVMEETKSHVFDFSGSSDSLVARFKDADPLGIEKIMDHVDTFIIDSLTTITERTLARGIDITKGATVERPSPGAYMARNNLAINFVRNMLQITGKYKKNIVFIAHEGAPDKNEDGIILNYAMSLGGQLPSQTALRINECWPMFEDGKNRKMIICRKARLREPAKSRMFDTTSIPEFEWKFNPMNWDDPSNMRIDKWFDEWKAAKFNKIPLPK